MMQDNVVPIRMDDALLSALKTAAAAQGLSDAELARRRLRSGLALAGMEGHSQLLAEAIRHRRPI